MNIRHVTITVPDPAETTRFLTDIFGVAAIDGDAGPTLAIGRSRLTVEAGAPGPAGYYHLAFDIPENTIVAARDLLAARVPILPASDSGIVSSAPGWDAHSLYFNAPGNLNLELIARHRLPNAIDRPFTLADVLGISEVGVVVDDTHAAVRDLRSAGLTPFGEPSESFAPVGDDHGLLIVVKSGRPWFPTQDQVVTHRPLRIEIEELDREVKLGPSATLTGTAVPTP